MGALEKRIESKHEKYSKLEISLSNQIEEKGLLVDVINSNISAIRDEILKLSNEIEDLIQDRKKIESTIDEMENRKNKSKERRLIIEDLLNI